MKKIYILGHFGSCNLGDRHQGRIVADYFVLEVFENITFINFTDYPRDEIPDQIDCITSYGGRPMKIFSPSLIDPSKPIFTTSVRGGAVTRSCLLVLSGSFTDESSWVPFLKRCLGKVSEIIIWGGFSGVDSSLQKKKLHWLGHPSITFLARGQDDLDLFREIISCDKTSEVLGDEMEKLPHLVVTLTKVIGRSKGRLAGDPIYSYLNTYPLTLPSIKNPKYKTFIGSFYFYENYPTEFYKLVDTSDLVIFIDTHCDRELTQEVTNNFPDKKVVSTNEIPELLTYLSESKVVVSNRLHGGVLAFGLGIPTIFVCPDGAKRGTKSFKYHNIALGGLGYDKELCKILEDLDIPKLPSIWECVNDEELKIYRDNNKNFRDKTAQTINLLRTILS